MTPQIRLGTWAKSALDAYGAGTAAGGEPAYPQLEADALEALDENARLKMQLANTLNDIAKEKEACKN